MNQQCPDKARDHQSHQAFLLTQPLDTQEAHHTVIGNQQNDGIRHVAKQPHQKGVHISTGFSKHGVVCNEYEKRKNGKQSHHRAKAFLRHDGIMRNGGLFFLFFYGNFFGFRLLLFMSFFQNHSLLRALEKSIVRAN